MTWPSNQLPLYLIPNPPLLISQAATAADPAPLSDTGAISIEGTIAEMLQWDYTVQVAHNWSLRDELYFDVAFNEFMATTKMGHTVATSGLLLEHFFIALPDESGVMRLSGRNQSGSSPSQWPVVTLRDQIWNPQRGSLANGVLSRTGEWWEVTHCFENVDDPLAFFSQMTFTWRNLDIRQKRAASLTAFIKRFVKIVAEGEIKESIYQTQAVRFSSPVFPLIHRFQTPPLGPVATLAQTLQQIFKAIAPTGQGQDCHLRVALQYESHVAGAGFPATIPVLLVDNLAFGPGSLPAIASGIAQEAAAWHKATSPPTAGAVLTLRLTLFGTVRHQQLPFIQIDAIPIVSIPKEPQWWNGAV